MTFDAPISFVLLYHALSFTFPWTLDAIVLFSHAPLLLQISQ